MCLLETTKYVPTVGARKETRRVHFSHFRSDRKEKSVSHSRSDRKEKSVTFLPQRSAHRPQRAHEYTLSFSAFPESNSSHFSNIFLRTAAFFCKKLLNFGSARQVENCKLQKGSGDLFVYVSLSRLSAFRTLMRREKETFIQDEEEEEEEQNVK